jgi:hypothetical protein
MLFLFFFICVTVLQGSSQDIGQKQSPWHFLNNNSSHFLQLDPKFPPISMEDILRGLSPHGYRGDTKRMHNVLNKAVQRKSLRIVVLGGSVPFGAGLEPNTYRDNWPSQLMQMLKEIFQMKVNVNNLAIRAVSSDAQATGHFKYLL